MVLPTPSLYQTSLLKGSTIPSHSRTAAIPDHATLSLAFLPLVSTLHIPKLQVCTLLCWLLCQFPSASQTSSLTLAKILGPRSVLLDSQAGRSSIQGSKGWSLRVSKGNGFCLPPQRPLQPLQALPPPVFLLENIHPHNSIAAVFSETSSPFQFYCVIKFPFY